MPTRPLQKIFMASAIAASVAFVAAPVSAASPLDSFSELLSTTTVIVMPFSSSSPATSSPTADEPAATSTDVSADETASSTSTPPTSTTTPPAAGAAAAGTAGPTDPPPPSAEPEPEAAPESSSVTDPADVIPETILTAETPTQPASYEPLPATAFGLANPYLYDRLSRQTTRIFLLNAFIIALLGVILSSDSMRRSLSERASRYFGVPGRYAGRMKKGTYESQHH